jgi:hypothetical protein
MAGSRNVRRRAAWSTFDPQAIGTERLATVSNGTSFALVAGAILEKQARVQNPDKDAFVAEACIGSLVVQDRSAEGVRDRPGPEPAALGLQATRSKRTGGSNQIGGRSHQVQTAPVGPGAGARNLSPLGAM